MHVLAVSTKKRRIVHVNEKQYIWYVSQDVDSCYMLLNILSEGKELVLSIPIGTQIAYIISKGRTFQGVQSGKWERYKLFSEVPNSITPQFVSECIKWAVDGRNAEMISWNGDSVPI